MKETMVRRIAAGVFFVPHRNPEGTSGNGGSVAPFRDVATGLGTPSGAQPQLFCIVQNGFGWEDLFCSSLWGFRYSKIRTHCWAKNMFWMKVVTPQQAMPHTLAPENAMSTKGRRRAHRESDGSARVGWEFHDPKGSSCKTRWNRLSPLSRISSRGTARIGFSSYEIITVDPATISAA